MEYITVSEHRIPVAAEVDVFIAGGGCAGVERGYFSGKKRPYGLGCRAALPWRNVDCGPDEQDRNCAAESGNCHKHQADGCPQGYRLH